MQTTTVDVHRLLLLLQRCSQKAVRILDIRSALHPMDAKRPPTLSRYSPHLAEHLAGCRPCRMRNRIRGLMSLAELQGTWLDLIATGDRDELARCGLSQWKLREDAVLLYQRLERVLAQVPECPESVPQTR